MTETTSLPPRPSSSRPSSAWPQLVRRRDDKVLAGVCAAAARATGTDPVLWRVLLAVLTVFGGSGLLLYGAGWLLIPQDGQAESIGERALRTRGRNLSTPTTVALVVVAALVLGASVGRGMGLVPLLVVGVVAYLVWRSRTERPTSSETVPAASDPATWTVPPTPGSWADPTTTVQQTPGRQQPGHTPPAPPAPGGGTAA